MKKAPKKFDNPIARPLLETFLDVEDTLDPLEGEARGKALDNLISITTFMTACAMMHYGGCCQKHMEATIEQTLKMLVKGVMNLFNEAHREDNEPLMTVVDDMDEFHALMKLAEEAGLPETEEELEDALRAARLFLAKAQGQA